MMASQRGDTATVERLLKHNVDVNLVDKSGRTALFYAAKSGFVNTTKLLVEVGKCNVNHRDKFGNDAFWMAETRGMYECVLYLFSHGAETGAPVKSRGFGSEVQFQRLMLRGDFPTARSAPLAMASLRGGKRIVIAGGNGVKRGQRQPNNMASLPDADEITGPNNDLYCTFFSSGFFFFFSLSWVPQFFCTLLESALCLLRLSFLISSELRYF